MALITYSEQLTIRPISYNWATFSIDGSGMTNYELALQDVEKLYLSKFLGPAMLKDIKAYPANYDEVLNGGTFVCGDIEEPFEGLKFIAAYLIAARYTVVGYKQDSFVGIVVKEETNARHTSSSERREQTDALKQIALDEWALLKQYLNINQESYELWQPGASKNGLRPRLGGVRKTFLR